MGSGLYRLSWTSLPTPSISPQWLSKFPLPCVTSPCVITFQLTLTKPKCTVTFWMHCTMEPSSCSSYKVHVWGLSPFLKTRGDMYWCITYLEARDTTYESVAYKVCDLLVRWFAERTFPSACPKIMRPSLSHIKQVTADCWGNLLHITFFSPL